jgi:peptide/nickel transport system permease protein
MTIPGLPLLIVAGAMLSELDFSRTRHLYGGGDAQPAGVAELARLVRVNASLRERDLCWQPGAGPSARRRLFGHLLPNTIPILVVMATMAVANAILSESALSYLGLGWYRHALLGQYDGRRQQPDRFPAPPVAVDAAGYRHFYHRHCH